jgi:hypothetical protein
VTPTRFAEQLGWLVDRAPTRIKERTVHGEGVRVLQPPTEAMRRFASANNARQFQAGHLYDRGFASLFAHYSDHDPARRFCSVALAMTCSPLVKTCSPWS